MFCFTEIYLKFFFPNYKKDVPLGTRIIGLTYKEIRDKNYPKVAALAKAVI